MTNDPREHHPPPPTGPGWIDVEKSLIDDEGEDHHEVVVEETEDADE
jgi:hypothetical protein